MQLTYLLTYATEYRNKAQNYAVDNDCPKGSRLSSAILLGKLCENFGQGNEKK